MKFVLVISLLALAVRVTRSVTIPETELWCPNCNNVLPPRNALESVISLSNTSLGTSSSCGDGICNTALMETCFTCPQDCGECIFNKPIYSCVNKDHITLTFDNGPTSLMSQLLDTLKKFNVNATFFVNGIHVVENVTASALNSNQTQWTNSTMADLIRRAISEGHVIGTNSYSHVGFVNGTTDATVPSNVSYVAFDTLQMQMVSNDVVLVDILGKSPLLFRPPYFEVNSTVLHVVESMGYLPVSMNVNVMDTLATRQDDIVGNLTLSVTRNRDIGGGLIMVQHDGPNVTASSLETVIQRIQALNLTIVDLPTCLNVSMDQVYRSDAWFNKSSLYPKVNQTAWFVNADLLSSTSPSPNTTTTTTTSTTELGSSTTTPSLNTTSSTGSLGNATMTETSMTLPLSSSTTSSLSSTDLVTSSMNTTTSSTVTNSSSSSSSSSMSMGTDATMPSSSSSLSSSSDLFSSTSSSTELPITTTVSDTDSTDHHEHATSFALKSWNPMKTRLDILIVLLVCIALFI